MIDDLRHLPKDGFQMIPPDLAVFLICMGGVLLLIINPIWRPV